MFYNAINCNILIGDIDMDYISFGKNRIEKNYSTRDMAADLATVIKQLGIGKASIMGISQGGMIAQYLAIDFPEIVEKLILAVTLCRQNETSKRVISNWISLANKNDFKGIFVDMAEKIYTQKRARVQRPFNPILSAFMRPKSLHNFIIQATACINHDSSALLHKIQCPVLIVGGDDDKVVGGKFVKRNSTVYKRKPSENLQRIWTQYL